MKNNFDINKFKVEEWLPKCVKIVLSDHVQNIQALYNGDIEYFKKVSSRFPDKEFGQRNFERLKKEHKQIYNKHIDGLLYFKELFQNRSMEKVWCNLVRKNDAETVSLVRYLLYGYFFLSGVRFDKNSKEHYAQSLKRRVQIVNDLFDRLSDHDLEHMIVNERFLYVDDGFPEEYRGEDYKFLFPYELHNEFMDMYKAYVKQLGTLRKALNSKAYNDYVYRQYPASRKKKGENSDALMFMRELSIRMRDRFKYAMNMEVVEIVNILFDCEFTDNDVVKYTSKIRKATKKVNIQM